MQFVDDCREIDVVLGRAELDCEITVRAQLAAPRVVDVDA
jgi:hypothetical protein